MATIEASELYLSVGSLRMESQPNGFVKIWLDGRPLECVTKISLECEVGCTPLVKVEFLPDCIVYRPDEPPQVSARPQETWRDREPLL